MKLPSKISSKRPWSRAEKMLWLLPILVGGGIGAAFWLPARMHKKAQAAKNYPTREVILPTANYSTQGFESSPDGKTLTTWESGAASLGWHRLDARSFQELKTWQFTIPKTTLAYSGYTGYHLLPDKKTVIFSRFKRFFSKDLGRDIYGPGWIQAVDVASKRVLWTYRFPHIQSIEGVSKDGRRVLISQSETDRARYIPAKGRYGSVPDYRVTNDYRLSLLDTSTGKLLMDLRHVPSYSAVLSPDSQTLALCTNSVVVEQWRRMGRTLQIRHVPNGKVLWTLKIPSCYVMGFQFSPSGRYLTVLGSINCKFSSSSHEKAEIGFWIYDLKTHTFKTSYKAPNSETSLLGLGLPQWSRDEKKLAVPYYWYPYPQKVFIFDSQFHLERTLNSRKTFAVNFSFSSDNKKLLALEAGKLLVWDLD